MSWRGRHDPTQAVSRAEPGLLNVTTLDGKQRHQRRLVMRDKLGVAALLHSNVLFVPYYGQSSGNHRGKMTAARLGAAMIYCHTVGVGRRFHIVIHVKHVCARALENGIGQYHVLDHADILWVPSGPRKHPAGLKNFFEMYAHRFSGQIMNSGPQVDDQCRTPVCTVIPHYFNLQCTPRLDRGANRVIGLVGWESSLAGWESLLLNQLNKEKRNDSAHIWIETEPRPGLTIRHSLWTYSHSKHEERIRNESRQRQCAFFERLRVAIAWNTQDLRSRVYEPGQRFSNPVILGVPTIAYAAQASYNEYNVFGGAQFLCADLRCVRAKIAEIRSGLLDATFAKLRSAVLSTVSWNATQERYIRLFADITKCGATTGTTNCRVSPVRRNMDGSLRPQPAPHSPTWAATHYVNGTTHADCK